MDRQTNFSIKYTGSGSVKLGKENFLLKVEEDEDESNESISIKSLNMSPSSCGDDFNQRKLSINSDSFEISLSLVNEPLQLPDIKPMDYFLKNFAYSKVPAELLEYKVDQLMTEIISSISESNHRARKNDSQMNTPLKSPIPIQQSYASQLNFAGVREALTAHFEIRSKSSIRCLVEMLRYTTFRSPLTESRNDSLFACCSEDDLQRISAQMTLISMELVASNASMRDMLPETNRPVTHCFIAIAGKGTALYRAMDANEDDSRVCTILPGHVLGFEAMEVPDDCFIKTGFEAVTAARWTLTLDHRPDLLLCCIPVIAMQQFVGSRGRAISKLCRDFLRSALLWRDLVEDRLRGIQLGPDEENGDPRHAVEEEIASHARVRVYLPGQRLFSQGTARSHLIVVLQGLCRHMRRVPSSLTGNDNDYTREKSVEVAVGGESDWLSSGDYSFLDGEAPSWVESLQEKELKHELESIHIFKERRLSNREAAGSPSQRRHSFGLGRSRRRFLLHKNSLVAMTRVEACVIPLEELILKQEHLVISDPRRKGHLALLQRLAVASHGRYSFLRATDEDVLKKHLEMARWQCDRRKVVRNLTCPRVKGGPSSGSDSGREERLSADTIRSRNVPQRPQTPRSSSRLQRPQPRPWSNIPFQTKL